MDPTSHKSFEAEKLSFSWIKAGKPDSAAGQCPKRSSTMVTVTSDAEMVIPMLSSLLVEANLTESQSKRVEFALQAIRSRSLYMPRVNRSTTLTRSDRRNTVNPISKEIQQADAEAYKWLNQAYLLDLSSDNVKTWAFLQPRALTSLRTVGMSPWIGRLAKGFCKAEGSGHLEKPPLSSSAGKLDAERGPISDMLSKLFRRDFDVLRLAAVCKGRTLRFVASRIFVELNLLEKLKIDTEAMDKLLRTLEEGYCQVPYHNECHAADVLLAVYSLIRESSIEEWITDEELFSLLMAAIIHDYKHPGLSNAFLISSADPLAVRYNDNAVLENYHLASFFAEINHPEKSVLTSLPAETRKLIRSRIIQLVLSTDMSEHFKLVNRFKALAMDPTSDLQGAQNRLGIFQMILKCADLNSTAKPLLLAKQWADRITEEFYLQGDREKTLGMEVSPMCARELSNVPRQQMQFIDFIVRPLFESFAEHCSALRPWLVELEKNWLYWESQANKACVPQIRRSSSADSFSTSEPQLQNADSAQSL